MTYMALTDDDLVRLLKDDVPCGDLTTEVAGIGCQIARLEFRARGAMVVCAIEEAARLFTLCGARADVSVKSGQRVEKDQLLFEVHGSVQVLHRVWKSAQVLVEWASGISTSSAAIVAAAYPVPVACTRKNVPNTRAMSVKAVRSGGATLHRLGLSESLLLFAEHRLYLVDAPAMTVARIKRAEPEKKLVVEVANVGEALVWAMAGADVLQLEKFTPGQLADCRSALDAQALQPILAAAGGIRADNAAAYVLPEPIYWSLQRPMQRRPGMFRCISSRFRQVREMIEFGFAKVDEIAQLADLLGELFTLEGDFHPDRGRQLQALRTIFDNPGSGRIFVLRIDGKVEGMANALITISTAEGGRVMLLEDVIVSVAHRGSGLGRQLVEHVLAWAQREGLTRVTLLADRDNQSALRFYQKLDFSPSRMIVLRRLLC